MSASSKNSKLQRPLSPHLQIYKLPMTALMSITHRASGVALSLGTLMVVWWLVAAATSEDAYDTAMWFAGTPLGLFMIFGWSFALYYHMCNGIRHLVWDTGRLFEKCAAKKAGVVVLLVSIVLTGATWYCAYAF